MNHSHESIRGSKITKIFQDLTKCSVLKHKFFDEVLTRSLQLPLSTKFLATLTVKIRSARSYLL